MNNILINGDLYVKIEPSIIYYNEPVEPQEVPEVSTLDLLTMISEMSEGNFNENWENFTESLVASAGSREIHPKRVTSYDDNIGFYKLFVDKSSYINLLQDDREKYCDDVEELNSTYLNLYDFIKQATFIGKYLEPKVLGIPRYQVIYEYQGIYLIKNVEDGTFSTIAKKHPAMENYVIGISFSDEYDKKSVYQSIIDQELKQNNPRTM